MAKKSNTVLAYETLLGIILPAGILEAFEVSEVTEEHTGIIEETGDKECFKIFYPRFFAWVNLFLLNHILSFSFHFSQFLSISKSAYPEKNFSHTIYVESFDIRIR